MTVHVVGSADEFDDGDRRIVEVDGLEIGVFRVDGEFRAYLNRCPHQLGPVCEGSFSGRQRASFERGSLEFRLEWSEETRVLVCPWHAWEFDVETGRNYPQREISLPSFPARVEDGDVVVEVG